MRNDACPACGATCGDAPVFVSPPVPLSRYALAASASQAAAAPRFRIEVLQCGRCGHGWNRAFSSDAVNYAEAAVAEGRGFSPAVREFLGARASWLLSKLSQPRPQIVEVGCGGGEFLEVLRGGADVIGIDPSAEAAAARESGLPIKVEPFDPDALLEEMQPDAVVARQFLEHVQDPARYVRAFARLAGRPGGKVYIEVPNSTVTFAASRFADLYYDHPGFFCPSSLTMLMHRCELSVVEMGTAFDGELLWCLAAPTATPKTTFDGARHGWVERVQAAAAAGKRIAVWGASGAGTMFLTTCGLGPDVVRWVVDSDPRKHGGFVPGTAQPVISPEQLPELAPDVIVILSQLHRREIETEVRHRLGDAVLVWTVE